MPLQPPQLHASPSPFPLISTPGTPNRSTAARFKHPYLRHCTTLPGKLLSLADLHSFSTSSLHARAVQAQAAQQAAGHSQHSRHSNRDRLPSPQLELEKSMCAAASESGPTVDKRHSQERRDSPRATSLLMCLLRSILYFATSC